MCENKPRSGGPFHTTRQTKKVSKFNNIHTNWRAFFTTLKFEHFFHGKKTFPESDVLSEFNMFYGQPVCIEEEKIFGTKKPLWNGVKFIGKTFIFLQFWLINSYVFQDYRLWRNQPVELGRPWNNSCSSPVLIHTSYLIKRTCAQKDLWMQFRKARNFTLQ